MVNQNQFPKRPIRKKRRKQEKKFGNNNRKKLLIVFIVLLIFICVLIGRLLYINLSSSDTYARIVMAQMDYDSKSIPFKRGDIKDRNGTVLATSEKVYNLILDPSQIMDKPDYYLEPTIQALVDVFGFDGNELRGLIQERPKQAYLRYKNGRQLSYDQKTEFEQTEKERNAAYRKSDDDNQSRFRVTGVWFEDEYRRIYPYGSTACNVIGFASGDGSRGTGGIEQYYNDSLIGVNGREYGYLDEDANLEGVVKSAVNGRTVVSTIDVNVQNILQKYIDEWQTSVGSHVTAAIAMNPNNGEILGMATSNKFDLNDPRKIEGYSEDQLYELGKKDAVSVYKREHPDTTLTYDELNALDFSAPKTAAIPDYTPPESLESDDPGVWTFTREGLYITAEWPGVERYTFYVHNGNASLKFDARTICVQGRSLS